MLPYDPRRAFIAERAKFETVLGVNSGEPEAAPDPVTKKYRRKGWPRLLEYFHLAAPHIGVSDEAVIYTGHALPDWCGIFALWAIKMAGLPVGTWIGGKGLGAVHGFSQLDLKSGDSPQPGDVGFIDRPGLGFHQHMNMIYSVNDDTIATIDGNSNGRISGPTTRHLKDFDAFLTAFNPKMFPPNPVGRWEVHIGVWTWIYNFKQIGSERFVEWSDLHHPTTPQGIGSWRIDNDAMHIQWDKSKDRWDLPLTADDQRGIWVDSDGRIDFIQARKLKANEWK
jgi:hypothetical protein